MNVPQFMRTKLHPPMFSLFITFISSSHFSMFIFALLVSERGPSHFSSLKYYPHTYSSHLYPEVINIIPHTFRASDEADTFLFSCIQFQDHIISAAYESSPSSLAFSS